MSSIESFIEKHWPLVREVYISPLSSGEKINEWQVELSFGNRTESFAGLSVKMALENADIWLSNSLEFYDEEISIGY